MAFYLISKGNPTVFDFPYLDGKESVRLEPTQIRGKPKVKLKPVGQDLFAIDIMTRDLVTIGPGKSIKLAKKLMELHNIHHLPVVVDHKLTGLLAESDTVGKSKKLLIHSCMSPLVLCASEETPVREIAQVFMHENIRALVIVNQDLKVAGIVTLRDLLAWLCFEHKFTK